MKDHINEPLSLSVLLAPFGLTGNEQESDFLLVGHLLEVVNQDMVAGKRKNTDPLEIAAIAWELGYDGAEKFLDEGPLLLYQGAKILDLNPFQII